MLRCVTESFALLLLLIHTEEEEKKRGRKYWNKDEGTEKKGKIRHERNTQAEKKQKNVEMSQAVKIKKKGFECFKAIIEC